MNIMKTLVCQQPGEWAWQSRNIPKPQKNEVLIKIKTVGICGTDIHAWGGKQPFFSYPRVLGHEICGDIVEVGCEAQQWQGGQQGAVIPYVGCNTCSACREGRGNCCENIAVFGVHRDGGFSEYLCVPQQNVLLAEGIAPEAVAPMRCGERRYERGMRCWWLAQDQSVWARRQLPKRKGQGSWWRMSAMNDVRM